MASVKRMKRGNQTASAIGLRGCYRVQITEGNEIVGDSGWVPNVVTNLGLEQYAAYTLIGNAGSKKALYLGLGTGTAPATDATSLNGEFNVTQRLAIGANTAFSSRTTSNGSCTVYLYGTFVSSVLNTTGNISNIGIFNTDAAATLFAGTTYSSSALNTNNNVNVTYQLQLG